MLVVPLVFCLSNFLVCVGIMTIIVWLMNTSNEWDGENHCIEKYLVAMAKNVTDLWKVVGVKPGEYINGLS